MTITEWQQLLKNHAQEVSFRTGVARKYFKKEWRPVLDLIHRYLTCEAGYRQRMYITSGLCLFL